MNTNPKLTQAELDTPLYDEEITILISHAEANATYQDLVQKHKDLGCKLQHDKRRLALALAQAIRSEGRCATEWEGALLEDAGLGKLETVPVLGPVQYLTEVDGHCEGRR
jgi:hypothetical protein